MDEAKQICSRSAHCLAFVFVPSITASGRPAVFDRGDPAPVFFKADVPAITQPPCQEGAPAASMDEVRSWVASAARCPQPHLTYMREFGWWDASFPPNDEEGLWVLAPSPSRGPSSVPKAVDGGSSGVDGGGGAAAIAKVAAMISKVEEARAAKAEAAAAAAA